MSGINLSSSCVQKQWQTHTHKMQITACFCQLIFTSVAQELEGLALQCFIKAIFIFYLVHNEIQWDPMLFGQKDPHKK